jgi:hypothetical protein
MWSPSSTALHLAPRHILYSRVQANTSSTMLVPDLPFYPHNYHCTPPAALHHYAPCSPQTPRHDCCANQLLAHSMNHHHQPRAAPPPADHHVGGADHGAGRSAGAGQHRAGVRLLRLPRQLLLLVPVAQLLPPVMGQLLLSVATQLQQGFLASVVSRHPPAPSCRWPWELVTLRGASQRCFGRVGDVLPCVLAGMPS